MTNNILLTHFDDNSFLYFSKGKFDNFCVFINHNNKVYAPHDYEYFTQMKNYANIYTPHLIYMIFIFVYINTNKSINYEIFNNIKSLCKKYFSEKDSVNLSKLFSILYATMIAEENKKFTKLGKRIKHLGVFLLLFENISPENAANMFKNKKWYEIDSMCKNRNI